MKYDVFISCKSEDYSDATPIYKYLEKKGLRVFLADVELRKKGRDVYGEIIDDALESADHIIVYASKASYVNSTYVKSEWRTFVEEKRSGRKLGNLITILRGVQVKELPIALRSVQSFPYKNYESVIDYLHVRPTVESENTSKSSSKIAGIAFRGLISILVLMTLSCFIVILGKEEKQEIVDVVKSQQGLSPLQNIDKAQSPNTETKPYTESIVSADSASFISSPVPMGSAQSPEKTQGKVTNEADVFNEAIRIKNYQEVRRLADDGYIDAYIPLAKYYLLNSKTHHLAETYAKKAQHIGLVGADEIIETLKLYGYYD